MNCDAVGRRTVLRSVGILAVAGLTGCTGNIAGDNGGEEIDADETVTVGPDDNTRFEPEELEIDPGDHVAFVWDSGGHSVEVTDRPEGSDWEGVSSLQDEGHVHEHTFETEGRYEYECSAHFVTDMTGTIVVGDAE